jgi:IS30 family transposase
LIYIQLTQEQRYQIYALKKIGHTQTEIAICLEVSKSTISRELHRNSGKRGYRPKQAQEKRDQRQKNKAKRRISGDDWISIEAKLRLDWSPEQISGWYKANGVLRISPEHIYQYVYADKQAGGELFKHLRCQKPGRKRPGKYDRRGLIPDRKSIDERPAVVEQRQRLGDWERDLIIGKHHQGAALTLTERKSRFTLLRKVDGKRAEAVMQATLDVLGWVPAVKTITNDNGKEFALHKTLSAALSANVYFAHPYASWERGTNENTNGLIRQYLPKNRNLTTLTTQEELMIMDRLNLRPRKCLAFKTPFEVFFGLHLVALTS